MKNKFFKTEIQVKSKIKKKGSFKSVFADLEAVQSPEVLSSYVDGGADFGSINLLNKFILKQPDLLYVLSTYVSQGANRNRDVFLRPVLAKIYKTPQNKFVDYEHDVSATEKDKNPNKYKVVGHIYDSALVAQETGSVIPEYELYYDEDGKLFEDDSPYRNQGMDISVAWVLYQFEYPELADLIIENYINGDNGKFGVSMEVLFTDYKFRVGELDLNEEFEFDATSIGKIEARKGSELADQLRPYWQKGELFNGQPVHRILGGSIFFSGMAITSNRAGARSENKSVASVVEDTIKNNDNTIFAEIVKAIAAKNKQFDISKCEIVDGQPSCECLENAVLAEMENLTKSLAEINSIIKK